MASMPLCRQAALPPLFMLALASCELTEITVAPGQRIVIVQSVLSRTDSLQFVVVEYSQAGEAYTGFTYPRIPPGSPKAPISGALVTIGHAGGACHGQVDTLVEQPPMDSGFAATGTYAGATCRPEPGEHLTLRVETPAGEIVTGTTMVPGASARDVSVGARAAPPGGTGTLDRERDTLRVGVTPISGKALQVEMRSDANREDLAIYAFADTLGLQFPGNLVNPFEGDDGQSVFRAGRYYALAVALTDVNYYDFLRSRSDPFTGRGFINHLEGGIGVFGSVETERYRLRVVASVDDPTEGVYRLTGTVDSTAVDLSLELYLDDLAPGQVSGFVQGVWTDGMMDLSGDGSFTQTGELFFYFGGFLTTETVVYGPPYQLAGTVRTGGEEFPLELRRYQTGRTGPLVDTLTARHISGPGVP